MSINGKEINVTESFRRQASWFFVIFCCALVSMATFMSIKSNKDSLSILKESTSSQLLAVCEAGLQAISVDEFMTFNSSEDMSRPEYQDTHNRLVDLQTKVGATYLYALKYIDGEAVFVFDTDAEKIPRFDAYELYPVHERAFLGNESIGIMNLQDEYGSFSTGALPIIKDGQVEGIICVDIADELLVRSERVSTWNTILLVMSLVLTLGLLCYLVTTLLGRVQGMQNRLERMANYDKLTGLPNRQYLLEHLSRLSKAKAPDPFALFFVDLDNFKKVNDSAGHDAGDELLQSVAEFLNNAGATTTAFRPGAGALTVTARIGGDEFILIVPGIDSEKAIAEFASNMLRKFSEKADNRHIKACNVGLSIGAALYPVHTKNIHALIKYADVAMYNAKRKGKNDYCIYQDGMIGED